MQRQTTSLVQPSCLASPRTSVSSATRLASAAVDAAVEVAAAGARVAAGTGASDSAICWHAQRPSLNNRRLVERKHNGIVTKQLKQRRKIWLIPVPLEGPSGCVQGRHGGMYDRGAMVVCRRTLRAQQQ